MIIALLFFIISSNLSYVLEHLSLAIATLFMFIAISYFVSRNTVWNKYKSSIKSNIFPHIVSFLDYEYSEKYDGDILRLDNLDILPFYTRRETEDKTTGIYKDIKFHIFDTKLFIQNARNDRLVFNGITIELEMHKNFNAITIVKQHKTSVNNYIQNNLEKINLESQKFEDIFDVYSTDQIKARCIMTLPFMERLMNLADSFNGQAIECYFYNNKILLMIPMNKNHFEPVNIKQYNNFIPESKIFLKEMNNLFQIIDYLKLHNNIMISS